MARGEQARADILDAAERLIAIHGVHVSLRDIALAAGQRNNSAVNYHFENRQELVEAVVRRRLDPMERERALMLAALGPEMRTDIHALLRVMVLPFTTVQGEYYARFLQAAALLVRIHVADGQGAVWRQILDDLAGAIPTTDASARRRRLNSVGTTMFALLADYERAVHEGDPSVDEPEEIVMMLAATLTAPLSGKHLVATVGSATR
ncbi:TetR/AcrR family transcriptional regulator [Mycobacterium timonense]|jgi:AcrR family transcriptional regulator|uniref:TetR family transcriptional regulator n=1 Tax=Mycobacterium timonense TaxID=701043 RepID=A0A7I9Z8P7_9MYCO|nr:TetR/AcrR family transcriptional regulator [Mycobacterium timonense]GFG97344.1 TetR family transcriptional regulator [Mycobacterium timonense]